MSEETNIVEFSRFMNHEEAELARERLLEAGITSLIPDDLLYNIHAGVSATSGGIPLMVDEKDLQEAKNILEKSGDEYPLPQDFDPSGPVEETPVEPTNLPSYGTAFMAGGVIALAVLGIWIMLMSRVIAAMLVYVFLVFIIGGLLGLIFRVCSRALARKNLDKKPGNDFQESRREGGRP
jgi:hypothetical protein